VSDVDFDRVMELLVELRTLEDDDRVARLDEIGAEDPALRAEVESILTHGDAEHFLDSPALDSSVQLARTLAGMDEPPLPGSIGRYRILGRLGVGGMGTVYHAEQDHPRREVALKLIRRHGLSDTILRRFRQEAEILGRLQHPGIAQIYDAGTYDDGEGGQPFFAMELVRGQPLTAYASEAGLDTRRRLELFAGVCDAVEHAHRNGVVHRDLKPDNILVVGGKDIGQPKVLDFGIARATDSDIQVTTLHTDVGQVIGTVPYMSPEQVAGDPSQLDARSDVYSLGVTLFELLTGRLPHDLQGKMIPEALRIIADEDPARLGTIDRSLRGDIESIVGKSLEKEKHRRYQSASALAADIRRYLDDQPIVARPPSTFYQIRKFSRRHRAVVASMVALMTVLIAATVVSSTLAVRESRERRRADRNTEELSRRLYAAEVFRIDRMIERGDQVTVIREALNALDEERRGWEWRHLAWRTGDSSLSTLIVPEAYGGVVHSTAAASPERDRVASAGGGGEIRVFELAAGGREILTLHGLDGKDAAIDWSADGRYIAGRGREGPVHVWEARTGAKIATLGVDVHEYNYVAISPDGSLVFAGYADHGQVWDVAAGTLRYRVAEFRHDPAFASNGRFVGYIDDWDGVTVAEADTGELVRRCRGHGATPTAVAFDPGGRRVATSSVDKTVMVWDIESGDRVSTFRGHGDSVNGLDFSSDGSLMVTAGADETVRLWDVTTGTQHAIFYGHATTVIRAWFTPDDRQIVSFDGSGTFKLWDVATIRDTVSLPGHPGARVTSLDFSPDGRRLISSSSDSTVRVWNVANGRRLRTFEEHGRPVARARFHPGGSAVASGDYDGHIVLWDAGTGRIRWSALQPEPEPSLRLSFSPNGSRLATSNGIDNSIRTWDVETGRELLVLRDCTTGVNGVVSLGDQVIAAVCDRTLTAYDAVSGTLLWSATPGSTLDPIAYDPVEHRVAVGDWQGTIHVLDAATGATLMTGRGHGSVLTAVAFNADGSRLFVGARDGTVKVWSLTGEELLTLRGNSEPYLELAISPDDRTIATSGPDGTILLWHAEPPSASKEEQTPSESSAEVIKVPGDQPTIQAGIDAASNGDVVKVAPGTYLETIDFIGKAITVSSTGGAAVTIIDGGGAFHVVQCVSGEGPGSVLDGFTITGGNAVGDFPHDRGGGMTNANGSSPKVANCTFTGNTATSGGGMSIDDDSSPKVSNCVFEDNRADSAGGGMACFGGHATMIDCTFRRNTAGVFDGGGIGCFESSTVTTIGCTFQGNTANGGGGMGVHGSSASVVGCRFVANVANYAGPGVNCQGSTMELVNTEMWNNTGGSLGASGASMSCAYDATVRLTNCTIAGNSGNTVGGLYTFKGTTTAVNCIFWNNAPVQIAHGGSGATTVTYSDVQGGYSGVGNIDRDPVFVDEVRGDLRILDRSAVVDAGINSAVPAEVTTDLDGNSRFVDDAGVADSGLGDPPVVDMGAHERQPDSG
jgi:WD40 repeat protein/serine/threonine protein kinase